MFRYLPLVVTLVNWCYARHIYQPGEQHLQTITGSPVAFCYAYVTSVLVLAIEVSYTTTTQPYTGTDPITGPTTVTTIPPSGTNPGTVVIQTPAALTPSGSFVTTTQPFTGTDPITGPTTVTTIPPSGTNPGTVVIQTPTAQVDLNAKPEASFVTTTQLFTGTDPITGPTTVATIPPSGTNPGTVIIQTPGSFVTTTELYTGTDPITGPTTVATIPPSGTNPGTVVIQTPAASSDAPLPTDACESAVIAPCSASGLDVNLFANSWDPAVGYGVPPKNNPDGGIGPDYYLSLPSLNSGLSNDLSFPAPIRPPNSEGIHLPEQSALLYFPSATTTYAGMTFNPTNFTLVYTGYYVPETSGAYEFCVNNADNVVNFYFGDAAFPCGNPAASVTPAGATPSIYAAYGFTPASVCTSIDLVAGLPYPMRAVYGNYGLPAGLPFTIAPPGGSATSDWTGQLYSGTC